MLKIHAKTDVGLVRDNNEDYFYIDESNRLVIMADGAGGHEHGEVASRLAVESCYQYLTREDYLQDTPDIRQTLMESITFANKHVIVYKDKHMQGSNMGTTLVCAHIGDDEVSYAWMGDSRIYLVSPGSSAIRQLNTDHTLYQEMLDRGEVGRSFNKHILSRMLGNNPYTSPDGDKDPLQQDDILLICTDGFSDMVTDEKMVTVLSEQDLDLERAIDKLIELAKGQGGRDNITVALGQAG